MTKKKTSTNKNFHEARRVKNDEFYTRLVDIENELSHYRDHFKNKIVYCNCDDPYRSNFVQYFALNFKFLGLKQLVATCYKHPDIDDSQFEIVKFRKGDDGRDLLLNGKYPYTRILVRNKKPIV